ncbi:MAG: tRNA epoxyqueuosine(34) reductase QueG [Planctomycetaceae bacterium]|nr:tRNA epoxyqueuosine(34) reductase QueG [Planctomycetaceae bacterium]
MFPANSAGELTNRVRNEARRLGFPLVGIAPAVASAGFEQFREWLAAGYAGEMHYLADRAAAYEHPEHVLAGARSVVMLALPYRTVEPTAPQAGEGRVSRYAWGDDYHDVIRDRLHQLADYLRAAQPGASARGVVDTAPLLEREFAQLAGLGWIGKNTLLLNRQWGSWFFLAALITDAELSYDPPHGTDHCGTCRACLDACPTDAFVAPYVLDARRCISYLTIELRGPIPADLREPLGDWVFGCDVCQDVCPWNHKVPTVHEPAFTPHTQSNPLDLNGLFELSDDQFRARFRHSPLWRAKRRGVLRNAAIVLGNSGYEGAIPALIRGLADSEPLVRGAAAWGLGRFRSHDAARRSLEQRLLVEPDDGVCAEIAAALG